MRHRTAASVVWSLAAALTASASWAQRGLDPGEQVPLLVSIDHNMRRIDMADMLDGTPLVLLYGSAT